MFRGRQLVMVRPMMLYFSRGCLNCQRTSTSLGCFAFDKP